MIPRTELQKQVIKLSSQLPPITPKVVEWAKKNVVSHMGYRTKRLIFCTECSQLFANTGVKDGKTEKCPYCGTTLKVVTSNKRTDKEEQYFCKVDKRKDFLIYRYIYIRRINTHKKPADYFIDEVMQKWVGTDETTTIVAKSRFIFSTYKFDGWSHLSEMAIRQRGKFYYSFDYNVFVHKSYPTQKLMKRYKKYGITKQLPNVDPYYYVRTIINEPKAETLLKSKQYGLLNYMVNGGAPFINRNWATIKICIRNKYIVKDANLFEDYLQLLERYKKDLHNACYVCPENLKKSHDIYTAKREKERLEQEKQQQLEMLLEQKEYEPKFLESKSKFFDFSISDNEIKIIVLKSLEEYKEEGNSMHHCIFSNEYFKKENSLILSARIGAKPIETVEVSLVTFDVMQSRGACNENTKYHNRIINMVRKNMGLIRKKANCIK